MNTGTVANLKIEVQARANGYTVVTTKKTWDDGHPMVDGSEGWVPSKATYVFISLDDLMKYIKETMT